MSTRRYVIRNSGDFARTIADARFVRGVTQEELARAVGLNRTYLAKLEAGAVVQQIERSLLVLRHLGVTLTAEMNTDDMNIDDAPDEGAAVLE